MKINFFTLNQNENTASYRIWVKDLSTYILDAGQQSKIFTKIEEIESDTEVLILCKSAYKFCDKIKNMFPEVLLGAINIPCNFISNNIDFVIVGSIEEYVSMSHYENVFIYPLIEKKFMNVPLKPHIAKNTFDVFFHGSYTHLFKFQPFLKNAIELFDRNVKKINLKIVTSDVNFKWEVGKPNVNIETYKYDDNFIKIAQSCDIGVVPNVSDARIFNKDIQSIVSTDFGLYDTDFFIRMKNKTNPGRAYVYYQLGIPVIHDMCPSSFELMCKTDYNICAHDEFSYLREFTKLLDPVKRNKIATKNKSVFEKHYNPDNHTTQLIKKIKEIK